MGTLRGSMTASRLDRNRKKNYFFSAERDLGPVSRKSLRPAHSVKLVFSYVVKGIKIKITVKFRASRRLRFEDTKRIIWPETRPKSFGTFEKPAPGNLSGRGLEFTHRALVSPQFQDGGYFARNSFYVQILCVFSILSKTREECTTSNLFERYWMENFVNKKMDFAKRLLYPSYSVVNSVVIYIYYSTFIHCTNSDFLIGWFVPRGPGLWRNNLLDVIIVV